MDTPRKDPRPVSREDSQQRSLNSKLIAEQIFRLLTHYWAANEDDAVRRLQAQDWINDLKDYPAATVSDACTAWRRTEEKRPTIAGLRKLCDERMPRGHTKPKPARPNSEYAAYADQRTRDWNDAAAARHQWALDHGCKDFAEVTKIGIQSVGQRRR